MNVKLNDLEISIITNALRVAAIKLARGES
jgi:hypothetical protein